MEKAHSWLAGRSPKHNIETAPWVVLGVRLTFAILTAISELRSRIEAPVTAKTLPFVV